MKTTRNRIGTAALLVTAMLLGGCGGDDPSSGDKAQGGDELQNSIIEAAEMRVEILKVSNRLVIDCMEGKDFDVHPQDLIEEPQSDQENWTKTYLAEEPPSQYLPPTVEDAQQNGFDVGRHYEPSGRVGHLEEEPFHEKPQEYQDEYDVARYGREYADFDDFMNGQKQPAPAGCQGDVDEALWGTPQDYLQSESEIYYQPGPPTPEVFDPEFQLERFWAIEALYGPREDWAACLKDRGQPYVEFDAQIGHRLWLYVDFFYEDATVWHDQEDQPEGDGDPYRGLEPPKGAPFDYQTALDMEFKLALDAAECGQETGLREQSITEWQNMWRDLAVEFETEIFAWYQGYEDALARAEAAIA